MLVSNHPWFPVIYAQTTIGERKPNPKDRALGLVGLYSNRAFHICDQVLNDSEAKTCAPHVL